MLLTPFNNASMSATTANAAVPIGTGIIASAGGGSNAGSGTGPIGSGTSGVNVTQPSSPQITVTPVTDPHLPSLQLQVNVIPRTLSVGDVFTITLTLANQAPDPAHNLTVTIPLPDGAVEQPTPQGSPTSILPTALPTANPTANSGASSTPVPTLVPSATTTFLARPVRPVHPVTTTTPTTITTLTPTTVTTPATVTTVTTVATVTTATPSSTPNSAGWTWQQAQLDAGSTITMTAVGRLVQTPPGDALVVNADAIAQDLTSLTHDTGGAIVIDPTLGPAITSFVPGTAVTLHSQDSRVEVQIPANAFDQPLTFKHNLVPDPGKAKAHEIVGRKAGLGTFYLSATTAGGDEIHQFDTPLTLTVSYTPQQLQAMGTSEDDLSLFYYDDIKFLSGQWMLTDSEIDRTHHIVVAHINHFSPWALSDGSSPSAAFIPSLQGWQVGFYSGDVNYSYPVQVPAGPRGIKPNLQLSYSSTSTDGATGTRAKQQSSWVGKGWSLDTGYVALNKLAGEGNPSRYYSLVFDGQSFDLVRGAALVQNPSLSNPSHWEWHPTNESFIRARAEEHGDSDSTRGGYKNNGTALPYTRYRWKVWTKSGIRYDFDEDMWQGFQDCSNGNSTAFMETYKWYLSRVVDTNRNVITYNYSRMSQSVNASCRGVHGIVDYAIMPSSITWGANAVTGWVDRFKVEFGASSRNIDNDVDHADNQLGQAPQEKWRLDTVKVFTNQVVPFNDNSWLLMRQYNLGYASDAASMLSDKSVETYQGSGVWNGDSNFKKLTLTSIQVVGSDGYSALPALTFAYGSSQNTRGTTYYPNADWNRLTGVNNNKGGTIGFVYENIGAYLSNSTSPEFRNSRRVISKVVNDGRGSCPESNSPPQHCYTWTYNYQGGSPQFNSLGTWFTGGILEEGHTHYPNSAVLYFNQYWDVLHDNSSQLIHKAGSEFRGHSKVVETDPNHNDTEHYFYQGGGQQADGSCTYPGDPYPAGHDSIKGNECFRTIQQQEFLKGKEYKTVTHTGAASVSNSTLSETDHSFAVNFISYGSDAYADDSLTGLWRAFTYESSIKQISWAWDGINNVNLSKTTNYTYGDSYGNVTQVDERNNANAVVRSTFHTYGTRIDNYSYIVDRVLEDKVKDGSNFDTSNWLALTVYGYDGSNGMGNPGQTGRLTLVRKYYDVPLQTGLPSTIHSSDTSYVYDTYGNQISATTYQNPGDLTNSVFSRPGGTNGATEGRVTRTYYEYTFATYPVQYDPPPDQWGITLRETADYDYRIGTLTSITDTNSQITSATYDVIGRILTIVKPGDSLQYPTSSFQYHDDELPVRYFVAKREISGSGNYRPIQTYYDGLGREIQTKSESVDVSENIVTDKIYDGLGQVVKQSQPRYVSQTGSSFWIYKSLDSDSVMNWTTTTYDGLGRPLSVQAPDSTTQHPDVTTMQYQIFYDNDYATNRLVTSTTDPNGHLTQHVSDEFGKLTRVTEYISNQQPYTWVSTTKYDYSPLDLLKQVVSTDLTHNPSTSTTLATINYDSLGRKINMQDATMGYWAYTYDVNGNLKTQTDAKSQVTNFYYDNLDRLIQKSYPETGNLSYYQYDADWSNMGKGRLSYEERREGSTITSMIRKHYNARGQETRIDYNELGLPNVGCADGCRTFQFAYDSADRLTSMTYPANQVAPGPGTPPTAETVTYNYDAAWRQTSVCSNIVGQSCYAHDTSYTALDQPQSYTLGNNLHQNYSFDTTMQRLSQMQVVRPGAPGNPDTTLFSHNYQYDTVGNVSAITNTITSPNEIQGFAYDHRDRLTDWTVRQGDNGTYTTNEQYTYDIIGNIKTKGAATNPITYNYANSGNGGPNAVSSRSQNGTPVPGASYSYDNNGNMTSGDGRSYTWNYENLPKSIIGNGITEVYGYDPDGARVKRLLTGGAATNPGTTYYMGGLYEEEYPRGSSDVKVRTLYSLNGQVVAQNEWAPTPPTNTPTRTATRTRTPSNTPINTPVFTFTPTATETPTNTSTPTSTDTPTPTYTPSLTYTPSITNTPTQTYTPTRTPTDTPTAQICTVVDAPLYLRSFDRPAPLSSGYLMDHGVPQSQSTNRLIVASPSPVSWFSSVYSNVDFASGDYTLQVRFNPCEYIEGGSYRPNGSGNSSSSGTNPGMQATNPGKVSNTQGSNATVDYHTAPLVPTTPGSAKSYVVQGLQGLQGSNRSRTSQPPQSSQGSQASQVSHQPQLYPTVWVQYTLQYVDSSGNNPVQIGTTLSARQYQESCQPINDTVVFSTGNAALHLAGGRLKLTITVTSDGDMAEVYIGDTYLTTPPYMIGSCPPTSTPTATPTCSTGAHQYFQPQTGAPQNGGTVQIGQKFTLDLMVDSGQYSVNAQQSYLRFDNTLLQNVSVSQSGCVVTNTVTIDQTNFDAQLQNEVCNGRLSPSGFLDGGCIFRGQPTNPGDLSFASGILSIGCDGVGGPCTGQFRVAQVAFCGIAPGETVLHWQFASGNSLSPRSPSDFATRDTQIIDTSGNNVASQSCYIADYYLNIVGPMLTLTPTPLTPYPTSTPTLTRTYTRTPTITNTPTSTPTATPPAILVGHVSWQGITQPTGTPNARNVLPLTITLKLGTTEVNYARQNTDPSGFFTVPVHTLSNGTYQWRVKGPNGVSGSNSNGLNPCFLANSGTVVLAGAAQTNMEVSTMKGGDANNDNIVNTSDFNILKSDFGQSSPKRSDFNNDGVVNTSDFNILKSNFGQAGVGGLGPVGPVGPVVGPVTVTTPTKNTLNILDTRAPTKATNSSHPSRPNTLVQTVVYFHTDHLGSISMVTAADGSVVSQQEFDPWGKVRSGLVAQTKRNFTGQKLDDTGLLFYGARYYDPSLARFTSADSIVPGAASACGCGVATLGQEQNSRLTVDFSASGFLTSMNGDNALTLSKGFWFQLSGSSRKKARYPWGPSNPQALNRYAYVLNNPLRYVDPTGHVYRTFPTCAATRRSTGKAYVGAYGLYGKNSSVWFRIDANNPGGPEMHVYVLKTERGTGQCLEEVGVYDPRFPSKWSDKHEHSGEEPNLPRGALDDLQKEWDKRFPPPNSDPIPDMPRISIPWWLIVLGGAMREGYFPVCGMGRLCY